MSAFVLLSTCLGATGLVGAAGCLVPPEEAEPPSSQKLGTNAEDLAGANMAGTNLAGTNLAGTNLAGTNLAGTNLAGANLGGTNLGGVNLGGSNLGGTNLAGTNLGGANLAGTNLAGTNLAGTNLAGTNLGGTNLAGTNLGGSLAGTNLGASSLGGADSGHDIHQLGAASNGLLYSGEDLLVPRTAQCSVLGIGSTAFSRLLAQQGSNARIEVALGKLPWGFAGVAGGASTLDAWEAIVWGDTSYCSFLMVAPPGTAWSGVAGFIKGVFRWNAPPTQSIDISGIEASGAVDPTMRTTIATYTGMMAASAKLAASTVTAPDFLAGELALVTATTNDRSVWVDFSAWMRDSTSNGRILANVESGTPPTYAEGAFSAYTNADGTVGVSLTPTVVGTDMLSASDELGVSYLAYRSGQAPKPAPTRCAAALYLNAKYGEPVPATQCDSALTWLEPNAAQGYPSGARTWATVAGTTAPMSAYQELPSASGNGTFLRAASRPIVSETYTFLWEPNHALPASAVGGVTGSNRAALGVGASSVAGCSSTDDANTAFNPLATAPWCSVGLPTVFTPRSLGYTWGAAIPITSYRLTSANDALATDPSDWTFQGCDGSCDVAADAGWTTLDTRKGETFATRLLAKTYAFANTHAYAQYRLRVTASARLGLQMELRQLELFDSGGAVLPLVGVDQTENGTVTWTGKACSTGELATRAFDNLKRAGAATRWCVSAAPSTARPIAVSYLMSGAGSALASYRLTSASDAPSRDPKSWTFEGCDGSCRVGVDTGWINLDTRSGETFATRYQTKSYALTGAAVYPQYRLRVTANNGDTSGFELGELELF